LVSFAKGGHKPGDGVGDVRGGHGCHNSNSADCMPNEPREF
jgi:hypothetical protein